MAPECWPLITFAAALAVSDALREACELETDIKWPNDVLASERKICGILAEVIDTETGRGIIVGMGINVTNEAFPEELESIAISIAGATGKRHDREPLLSSLLRALGRWYVLLHELNGGEKIVAEWTSRSSYAEGKLVKVVNMDETLTGTTRGLEADGALRLEINKGTITSVRAGDVTSLRPEFIQGS
jgi:BirA family biotin operon repressor/biotin-[acetyl-CoA-carboxylase] ligase